MLSTHLLHVPLCTALLAVYHTTETNRHRGWHRRCSARASSPATGCGTNVQGRFQGEAAVSLQLLRSTHQAGMMRTSQETYSTLVRAVSENPHAVQRETKLSLASALAASTRFLQHSQVFSKVLWKSHFRAGKGPENHRFTPWCLSSENCKQPTNAGQDFGGIWLPFQTWGFFSYNM